MSRGLLDGLSSKPQPRGLQEGLSEIPQQPLSAESQMRIKAILAFEAIEDSAELTIN
jgi:hypothetical protein